MTGMHHMADVEAAIADRTRMFVDAYCRGDADLLVASYFVEDMDGPAAYPPGQRPVEGCAALITMFRDQMLAAPQIRLETLHITASDMVACEVGRAHLTLMDGMAATGRYIVCWIATGDGWRAKTDFFAADGWTD